MPIPHDPPAIIAPVESRDPGTATALTLGGTVLALTAAALVVLPRMQGCSGCGDDVAAPAVLLSAFVVLPSLGSVYAGDYLSIGTGVRLVGAASLVAMARFTEGEAEKVAGIAGACAMVGGVIIDIITSREAVRSHNAGLAIVPVVRGGGGGAMLTARF